MNGVTNDFIRSEKPGDFISFSDPLGDSFDSRPEDRTQGRYWKGFDRDDKNIKTRYRVIEGDLGANLRRAESGKGSTEVVLVAAARVQGKYAASRSSFLAVTC